MKTMQIAAMAFSLGAVVLALPATSYAQQEKLNNVTFDLQDAPIRSVLEAAFKQAGILNYLIDNNVVGFVTLKITEQPFENALKLIMRAASVPLTYTKENSVWIVKPRTITPPTDTSNNQPPDPNSTPVVRPDAAYERINLTYLDPMDLQMVFGGMTNIHFFTRMGGAMMGGMGGMMGGMGGMGGGMMGGMGGMGGGMMGGMGGMGGFGGFGR